MPTAGIDWLDLITKGVIVLVLFSSSPCGCSAGCSAGAPKRGGRLEVLESRALAPKASLHLVADRRPPARRGAHAERDGLPRRARRGGTGDRRGRRRAAEDDRRPRAFRSASHRRRARRAASARPTLGPTLDCAAPADRRRDAAGWRRSSAGAGSDEPPPPGPDAAAGVHRLHRRRLLVHAPGQSDISVKVGDGQASNGNGQFALSLELLVAITVLSLVPAILMLATSFTGSSWSCRCSAAPSGIPNLPPNQVILGLSLFLTSS